MTCNKILSGIAMTVIVAFSACNNDDLTIGKSLTSEADKLDVTSAAFPVATRTVTVDSVVARTSDCYFGRIKDPETGAYITTDFMSQFHILESFELVDEDSIVSKENGQVVADSCELLIYLDEASVFCDSLAAMKMRISELAKPVEDGRYYYSNFDPVQLGYLRENGLQKTKVLYENASIHWSGPQIKSFVEELRHEGWTFTYIGANQDVEAVAGSMGIRNTLAFEETEEGAKRMIAQDRSSRNSFFNKIARFKKLGLECLEEEDGYFEK